MKFLALFLILLQAPVLDKNTSGTVALTEPMVAPTVKHEKKTQTQTYDSVTRSCPEGYEGHYVARQPGFDGAFPDWNFEQGEVMYTVCFKKQFMDEIRKNPELLSARPIIKPA